jgi:hypothetical protein
MSALFTFTPRQGYNLRDIMFELISNKDFILYLKENADKRLVMELYEKASKSDKDLMYAYYYKVILKCAIDAFTNDGWEGVDKVKADHLLKTLFAKGLMRNKKTGEEEMYLEEKSKMPKARLLKFMTDCIIFLEVEKGISVPDADEYKSFIQTGMTGFKSIKNQRDF